MLRRVANLDPVLKLLTFCAVVGIGSVLLLVSQSASYVTAQEGQLKMSELLAQIRDEEILFRFSVPLVADQSTWTVPDGIDGPDDETTIQIDEIGEDYICFRERAGQAIFKRCTPFTNIVLISVLDMPE
ncbi:MAG: hypothetical protein IT320_18645 [Anaerolineae bacterium]|nr:hypothetical protein [Anaerolineae bacterium]